LSHIKQILHTRVFGDWLPQRLRFLQRRLQLDVQRGGNELGNAVDFGVEYPSSASLPPGVWFKRDDLRNVLPTVLLGDIVTWPRRFVQKSMSISIEISGFESAQTGAHTEWDRRQYFQAVRHQASGCRAAPAHGYLILAGIADEVPNDHEVANCICLMIAISAPLLVNLQRMP
jgi:hypothetical protein